MRFGVSLPKSRTTTNSTTATTESVYSCDKCPFSASLPESLVAHDKSVHANVNDDEAEEEQSVDSIIIKGDDDEIILSATREQSGTSSSSATNNGFLPASTESNDEQPPASARKPRVFASLKQTGATDSAAVHETAKMLMPPPPPPSSSTASTSMTKAASRIVRRMDIPWKCPYCSYHTDVKKRTLLHLKNAHAMDGTAGEFACRIAGCEAAFGTKTSLARHRAIEHGVRVRPSYTCDLCTHVSHSPSQLDTHKKRAHSGGEFPCMTCNMSFSTRGGLYTHRREMHTLRGGNVAKLAKRQDRGGVTRRHVVYIDENDVAASQALFSDTAAAGDNTLTAAAAPLSKFKQQQQLARVQPMTLPTPSVVGQFSRDLTALPDSEEAAATTYLYPCFECDHIAASCSLLEMHQKKAHKIMPGEGLGPLTAELLEELKRYNRNDTKSQSDTDVENDAVDADDAVVADDALLLVSEPMDEGDLAADDDDDENAVLSIPRQQTFAIGPQIARGSSDVVSELALQKLSTMGPFTRTQHLETCPHCNYQTDKGSQFERHLREVHNTDRNMRGNFACDFDGCKARFMREQGLRIHYGRVHPNAKKSRSSAKNSNKTDDHHNGEEPDETADSTVKTKKKPSIYLVPKKSFCCPYCAVTQTSKAKLTKHVNALHVTNNTTDAGLTEQPPEQEQQINGNVVDVAEGDVEHVDDAEQQESLQIEEQQSQLEEAVMETA